MAPKLQIVTILMQVHDFHGIEIVGWYESVFLLALFSFQSVWRKAYIYFSFRWTFLASIVACEVCILICAGGGIHFSSFTAIASIAVPDKRDACTGFAGFDIDLSFGEASVVTISLIFIASDTPKPAKVIFHGIILYIIVIESIAIMYFNSQKAETTYLWESLVVIGLLVGSILLSMIFMIVRIWLGECTMLVNRLLKERSVYGGMAFIGYRRLPDVGYGFGIQVSTLAVQALVILEDISSAIAIILFEDLAVDSAFAETLIKSVAVYDSIVSQRKVVSTGATELRKIFTAERSKDDFRSYVAASKKAYIIGIAMVGLMPLAVFGCKCYNWKKTNGTKAAKKGESENQNNDFTERMEIWK
ncbi:uncharacterized protein EAE97_002094 [Botrytis byssoidea]|uniref:Uncharacterized protein n=1 Tax=Botrytis byssoidea TaxID=139641 RepID=A0A9P5IX28_9HELO|nr:uncharacterized protein EAE97_002094 [Botrytis byssoidea]KAF7952597.1 hypothetical protein EAE97_002094 [Botrytis byssoidea]